MSAIITCPECSRTRRNRGRGLCSGCYSRLEAHGCLDLYPPRRPKGTTPRPHVDRYDIDHAAVERVLSGDYRTPCNPAERAEVARRWAASGRALNDLQRLTGWLVWRYYRIKEAA